MTQPENGSCVRKKWKSNRVQVDSYGHLTNAQKGSPHTPLLVANKENKEWQILAVGQLCWRKLPPRTTGMLPA